MPRIVRFYIRHVLIGFAAAAVFVVLVLWFDVGGLWRLISGSPDGLLAAVLLFVFNGIVFAGVQFGIAVMALGEAETPPHGPRRQPTGGPQTVKVTGPPGPSRD
jgi:hypothetical protein